MGRRRTNKKKRAKKQKTLDLHGISHLKVELKVETFIFDYQNQLPVYIITGNSPEMKKIVTLILEQHNFNYTIGDAFNSGYIIVES